MFNNLKDEKEVSILTREVESPSGSSINFFKTTKGKVIAISVVSVINGVLYFAISVEGGSNIQDLFSISGGTANTAIFGISVGASLVYTMFTYKTLESISLKIDTISKGIFSFLAPFSAAAFLTAGREGAELLHFNEAASLAIGISLFGLRIVNCVDASVKFPDRLLETQQTWSEAWQIADYCEITRLIIVWLSSLGYAIATTDAIYQATQIIFSEWFGIDQNIVKPISFIASAFGALGTLPLNVYWSHRGLRQLTFGGKENDDGENPDLTDRYTYMGLLFVAPVILGLLGGVTASTGAVFGKLGTFAEIVRITTSISYAACAGTPGMATLLRSISKYLQALVCREKNNLLESPLISNEDSQENIVVNELDNMLDENLKEKEKPGLVGAPTLFNTQPNQRDEYEETTSTPKKRRGCCIIM